MKIATIILAASLTLSVSALPIVKSGESIAFLGDSITELGNSFPCGYIHLVMDGLRRSGVNAKSIPAGISGHKSNNMLARVERDVISKKPAWMTLSCGVNDVWHGARGVTLENYKKNITALVDAAQKSGVKVVILTATMIGEDAKNANNAKLAQYNEFLRSLARERNLTLADLNKAMVKRVAELAAADKKPAKDKKYLTRDGVHMNKNGNIMMASGILAALGVPQKDIDSYAKIWRTYPENTRIVVTFTVDEWKKVCAAAKKNKKNPDRFAKDLILSNVK